MVFSIFHGGLIERVLDKFLGPEREAHWRGGLIEMEAKKNSQYAIFKSFQAHKGKKLQNNKLKDE